MPSTLLEVALRFDVDRQTIRRMLELERRQAQLHTDAITVLIDAIAYPEDLPPEEPDPEPLEPRVDPPAPRITLREQPDPDPAPQPVEADPEPELEPVDRPDGPLVDTDVPSYRDEARPALERIRDWACDVGAREGEFATGAIAAGTGLAPPTVTGLLPQLLERGIIERTTEARRGRGVRYRYAPIKASTGPARPKPPTPEEIAVRDSPLPPISSGGGVPVAGVGRPRSSRKEIDALLGAAHRAGWKVEVAPGGHFRVTNLAGQKLTIASSPKSNATHKVRADLRRMGLRLDA